MPSFTACALRLRELEPKHDFINTVRGYGFRLELP